ncbi:MAG: hypothetical protein IJY26_04315, partial [Clostridia bacterium]|nr:hypothetical protein [Clostridia bacterium]
MKIKKFLTVVLTFIFSVVFLLSFPACAPVAEYNQNMLLQRTAPYASFAPGAQWRDTQGELIQAHGGQIQRMPVSDGKGGKVEKYVWVGEDKTSGHLGNGIAV